MFYPGKSHIFDFLDTLVFLSLSFDLWPDLVIDLIYGKSQILFTQLFNSINTLIALISLSLFLISFLDLFKFLFKSWMSLFMWSLSSNVLASWIYENFTSLTTYFEKFSNWIILIRLPRIMYRHRVCVKCLVSHYSSSFAATFRISSRAKYQYLQY